MGESVLGYSKIRHSSTPIRDHNDILYDLIPILHLFFYPRYSLWTPGEGCLSESFGLGSGLLSKVQRLSRSVRKKDEGTYPVTYKVEG